MQQTVLAAHKKQFEKEQKVSEELPEENGIRVLKSKFGLRRIPLNSLGNLLVSDCKTARVLPLEPLSASCSSFTFWRTCKVDSTSTGTKAGRYDWLIIIAVIGRVPARSVNPDRPGLKPLRTKLKFSQGEQ